MNYFKLEEEIEYSNERYVVMDVTKYQGKDYAFAAHLIGNTNDPDENFQVFTIESGEEKLIEDVELLNNLLQIFTKNLNERYGGGK